MDSLIKDAPADGFLNELREVALFHALVAKIRAQGVVGLFRPGNRQTRHFRFGQGIVLHGKYDFCQTHNTKYLPSSYHFKLLIAVRHRLSA